MTEIQLYSSDVKANIGIPTEWDELQQAELKRYCQILMTPGMEELKAKLLFFLFLLENRSNQVQPGLYKKLLNRLNDQDIAGAYGMVDIFFTTNKFTNNLLPKITIGKDVFTGREADFNNLTCGEFEDADIYVNLFNETKDLDCLQNLMSILYRKDNEPYMVFNAKIAKLETTDTTAAKAILCKVEPWMIYATYLWFWGCKAALPEYFPTVFSMGDGEKSDYAFTKCIHAGAGPKNGTRDQIRVTLLKEFFLDMEIEAIQAQSLKSK